MRLKTYQVGELMGIFFLLASTATQIFYVEPLRREIEWRLAAFTMQQSGQLQMKAIYDGRVATLRAVGAPDAQIAASETEGKQMTDKFKTADANIADYLMAKEPVENWLQIAVVALFAIGSLLAGIGRAMEMVAGRRLE
jgi:predicted exporter